MEIQKLNKSNKEEMLNLFKMCFNSDCVSEGFEYFISSDELWNYIWGVKKDKELIASYIAYDGETKIRKIPFKINYFDGVVSKPGERMKGIVREMMNNHVKIAQEKGIELLLLDPFKHSFYEELGYTTAIDIAKYEIPFSLLKRPLKEETTYSMYSGFIYGSELFEQKIKKILEIDWEQSNYNPLKIPAVYFKRMFKDKKHQVCLFEEKEIPKGYILYTLENRIMHIHRVLYFDITAIKTLNKFLYQYKDQIEKVIFELAPDDLPIHHLCETLRAGSKEISKIKRPSRMIKILEIEKVLKKLINNKKLPEFLLSIEDAFIEKNNKTFRIKNHQLLKVENKISGEDIDHIKLNIKDFVPILTGFSSIREKYTQGYIAVNGAFSTSWNQHDVPEILRELEFHLPPLSTYSTEFCY